LFLDRRRRLLAHRALTRGSDAFTVVDPRQVFRVAVGCSASAVILAHNHPSGDPTPSRQDEDVTRRVVQAGRTLGIPVLDHLVVAGARYVSLAESGAVPELGDRVEGACWTR
jgi:DNA repair protein RadC